MISSAISSQYNQSLYTSDTSSGTGILKGVSDKESTTDSTMNVANLGKDDFLKLLLAELKYQDPLNPADNTEFVAQLAQFSSLEQMTQMNENLEATLDKNTTMADTIKNAMMISYFGKAVEVESAEFLYDGESDETNLRFELDAASASTKINILNADGDTIRVLDAGALEKGGNSVVWDGMKSSGVYAREGTYSFEVVAKDSAGEKIAVTPLTTGVVQGISKEDDGAYLNIGGIYVPFDKIRQVAELFE